MNLFFQAIKQRMPTVALIASLPVIDGESFQDQASANFGRKLGTKYAKWKNRKIQTERKPE